jgi:uncharacterized protein
MTFKTLISCALVFGLLGCANEPAVQLRGANFGVELAIDDATRAKGLMFRETMGKDQGMLFVFPDEQPRSFWMHNCKIALDILYFDSQRKLVGKALSVPTCNLPAAQCPNYPSERPAKYVLELNAGTASALGVSLGDELGIPGNLPAIR